MARKRSVAELKRSPAKREVDEIVRRPYSIEFAYGVSPDEGVLAYAVEWPDCFAAGRTREEALAALERTMRDLAAYRAEHGLEIPDPVSTFSGRLVLRLPRALHRDAVHRAMKEGTSLNGWLMSAIARELGPTSENQARGTEVREPKAAYRAGRATGGPKSLGRRRPSENLIRRHR